MKVLITAGGTEEPVDGVRRLTNVSTGATGAVIAGRFAEAGAELLLLHAERAAVSRLPVVRETFVTFSDLEAALRRRLGSEHWDAVIHLAAVGDYSVASVEVDGRKIKTVGRGKIGSGRDVVIRLRPNPKLLDSLRAWSLNPEITVVGFKLTNDPEPADRMVQVRTLLDRGVTDLVVHNDLREIDAVRHVATIFGSDGDCFRTHTKQQLADELYRLLAKGDLP
jgi:phosphopantothenoylcysteine synthetase/decarboxylase